MINAYKRPLHINSPGMLLASDGVAAKKKTFKIEERNIVAIRAHSYHLCMETIMQTLTHLPACTEQTSALCMYIETLKMPLASIHPPPLLPGIWRGGDQIYGVWNNITHQHLRGLVHLPCLTHTPKAHIHAWVINPNRQQNLLPLERVVDLWDADACLKHCSILRAW